LLHGRVRATLPEVVHQRSDMLPAILVLRRLPGVPLTQRLNLVGSVLPEIIETVASFRCATSSSYGEIVGRYPPAPNEKQLSVYVANLSRYWLATVRKYRGTTDLGQLASFFARFEVKSSILAKGPSFSHSDMRLDNVLVHQGHPAIIDYDTAFWFVPELDVCKLYLNMCWYRCAPELPEFVKVTANAYGLSRDQVREGIVRFCWIAGLRVLAWLAGQGRQDEFAAIYGYLRSFYGAKA